MNIGFFDSGLGGLLVLKAVVKELPQYDYVYYGDTANLPYGDKSEQEIYRLTKQAIKELFDRNCLLVIVACNTASAETIRKLQDTFLLQEYPDRRILGVIVPTVEEVLAGECNNAVLLATKRTVESKKYEQELDKLAGNSVTLVAIATPKLVPLIEDQEVIEAEQSAIETLAAEVRTGSVVLLGCTHYILLKDRLRSHFGPDVTFISQDEVIPKKLADYLQRHPEIMSRLSNSGKRDIVLTEHKASYDRLVAEFIGGSYITDSN